MTALPHDRLIERFLEPRLEDGHPTSLQRGKTLVALLYEPYLTAGLGQSDGGHQPHVARSENRHGFAASVHPPRS